MFRGPVRNDWIATVEIPVLRGGQPFRELVVAMEAQSFAPLLSSNNLPNGWLVGIADTSGRYLARTDRHDDVVGQFASEGWRRSLGNEGVSEFASLEGDQLVNANAVSRLSGWTVGVAVRKDVLDAPITRILLLAS